MPAACDPAFLDGGGVEVWIASLATAAAWPELLSPEERVRAARLQGSDSRARFVAARTLLRRLLAPLLELEATSIPLVLSPTGKPALGAARAVQFSLAHAGEYVAVALAYGRAVGIDLEAPRALPDPAALARRFLHPAEAAIIAAAAESERALQFQRCWTRKEAVVKAWGTGMAEELKRFHVPLDAVLERATIERAGACWTLRDVPLPAVGYTCALVAAGEDCRFTARQAD